MNTDQIAQLSAVKFRAMLIVWTFGIWGSRMRNIQADTDLTGVEQASASGIAFLFLITAAATGAAVLKGARWERYPLLALVALGIIRWTIRGPIILLSDEWETPFKVVHTALWILTVIVSVLGWKEHRQHRQDEVDQQRQAVSSS